MTIFDRILRTSLLSRFLLFAALLVAPSSLRAYDAELDAGARFGSEPPSALGAFSWSVSSFFGAYAVGAAADGEVSIDAEGYPGIDAVFTGDASYSLGRLVSGLRLESAVLHSAVSGEDSIDLTLSAPFTLNGRDLSFSAAPLIGAAFFDDESVDFGAALSVSYLAGDFVLKPGAALVRTLYSNGARTLEVAPSVGLVWYPGIPVSADISVAWSRTETDDGGASTSYPVSAFISAAPFPWLCVTVGFESEGELWKPTEYRVDGEIEFLKYGRSGTALRFPVAAYYSRADEDDGEFGVSVMVGYSFAGE